MASKNIYLTFTESSCNILGMKNNKPRIYVTDNFKNLADMHRTNASLARRMGVYPITMSKAINGGTVQAAFVASAMKITGLPFESLFEVR